MFFVIVCLFICGLACYCCKSGQPKSEPVSNTVLADLQRLVAKDRACAKPDHSLMKYYWHDLPGNIEIVNRLLSLGYWRNSAGQMINGKNVVWLECTEAMGWTAYVKNGRGLQPCWHPQKFMDHFELLLGQ